jgi:hypothetical protein
METPTQDELTQAASLLAQRRNRKLGSEGLSRMARSASRLKTELYGPDWAKKVQRGERLVPLPPQPESE